MASFDLNDYVQVNERIEKFYEEYPEGSIQTEIIMNDNGMVIFKAYAYRNSEDTRPATGHAMEKEGSSYINKTSHIENCETSAIGRALGVLGIGSEENMASADELAAALMNQVEYPEGKRFLGTYCSEHALSLPEICEKHNINRTAKKSDWYAVLAKVMAECGE